MPPDNKKRMSERVQSIKENLEKLSPPQQEAIKKETDRLRNVLKIEAEKYEDAKAHGTSAKELAAQKAVMASGSMRLGSFMDSLTDLDTCRQTADGLMNKEKQENPEKTKEDERLERELDAISIESWERDVEGLAALFGEGPELEDLPAEKEERKIEELRVEEPGVEEPKVEEPKVEESKIEEQKIEEQKFDEPKQSLPDEPKADKEAEAKELLSEFQRIYSEFQKSNMTEAELAEHTKQCNKDNLDFSKSSFGIRTEIANDESKTDLADYCSHFQQQGADKLTSLHQNRWTLKTMDKMSKLSDGEIDALLKNVKLNKENQKPEAGDKPDDEKQKDADERKRLFFRQAVEKSRQTINEANKKLEASIDSDKNSLKDYKEGIKSFKPPEQSQKPLEQLNKPVAAPRMSGGELFSHLLVIFFSDDMEITNVALHNLTGMNSMLGLDLKKSVDKHLQDREVSDMKREKEKRELEEFKEKEAEQLKTKEEAEINKEEKQQENKQDTRENIKFNELNNISLNKSNVSEPKPADNNEPQKSEVLSQQSLRK